MERLKGYIKDFKEIISRPEMLILPSTLAYYFVLAIVPVITILLFIATSFHLSLSFIMDFFQSHLSSEVVSLITPILTSDHNFFKMLIYILVAVFLASNGSDAIIVASNTVFNISNRNVFQRRLKALLITLIIIMLFTFMLVVPVFGNQILYVLKVIGLNTRIIELSQIVYNVLNVPITIGVIYLMIKAIYVIAPDNKIKSKYVRKGALFTTVFWVLSTFVYSEYVSNIAKYDVYYAGLSSIVVLMIWFYLLAFIFVIGLIMNYRNTYEQIDKTNTIKLKELEEKVKANKTKK